MEKIILVTKTQGKGGYQARVFGKNPAIQTFAKTEIEALKTLVERLETIDKKFIQSPFECGEVTKITGRGSTLKIGSWCSDICFDNHPSNQTQREKIEHCDVPECPECNMVAYKAGYTAGVEAGKKEVVKLLHIYSVSAPEESRSATFTLKQFLSLLSNKEEV